MIYYFTCTFPYLTLWTAPSITVLGFHDEMPFLFSSSSLLFRLHLFCPSLKCWSPASFHSSFLRWCWLTKLKVPVTEKQVLYYTPVSDPFTNFTFKFLSYLLPPFNLEKSPFFQFLTHFFPFKFSYEWFFLNTSPILSLLYVDHLSGFPLPTEQSSHSSAGKWGFSWWGNVPPVPLTSLHYSHLGAMHSSWFCAWVPAAPSACYPLFFIKAKSSTHFSSLLWEKNYRSMAFPWGELETSYCVLLGHSLLTIMMHSHWSLPPAPELCILLIFVVTQT